MGTLAPIAHNEHLYAPLRLPASSMLFNPSAPVTIFNPRPQVIDSTSNTSRTRREHDIRVLCVDDNPLIAEAFSVKLSRTPGFRWLGHLDSTIRLSEEVAEQAPDVVLLDVDIPGEDTFAALQQLIRRTECDVKVLMVSGHVRLDLIDRAVESGAWGYISKSDPSDAIVDAIRRVHRGEFVMSEIVARAYQQK